jgi:hypothetical protein
MSDVFGRVVMDASVANAKRIEALKERVAELEAANAALEARLAERDEWEVVPDGIHNTDSPEVLYVKDKLLSIVGEYWVYLPQDYALCRRRTATESEGEKK